MITNVDDNFAKLQQKLKDLKIDDNTIVIFMTDNGTASGYKTVKGKLHGFNAGMRGTKIANMMEVIEFLFHFLS